jgi:putative transposase
MPPGEQCHPIQLRVRRRGARSARWATAVEVCRRDGISETTFYRWKAQIRRPGMGEAKRLRQLEAENSRLTRLLADAHLDNAALKDLLAKNW